MKNEKKVLGVIPARGGSKGIPDKNIKILGGKPLIAYTILAAKSSDYIDRIIVTTDSDKIAEVAIEYGADVPFRRPSELSQDTSKSIEALIHARDWVRENDGEYDIILLLQPTSPLRRSKEIDGAIDLFYKHDCELGVVTVSEVLENPVLIRKMDEHELLHPILPISSTIRRQDMPRFYRVDGAVFVNDFREVSLDTSLNDNPLGYEISRERSVDIDSIEDFERAERLLNELANTDTP